MPASGSRSVCEVSQFWQYEQWKSQPSIPKVSVRGAGQEVEERLLLHGVGLQRGHVAAGHHQLAAAVEAHLAHAPQPVGDQAAVAAGVAAHLVVGQALIELALHSVCVEDIGQSRDRHRSPRSHYSARQAHAAVPQRSCHSERSEESGEGPQHCVFAVPRPKGEACNTLPRPFPSFRPTGETLPPFQPKPPVIPSRSEESGAGAPGLRSRHPSAPSLFPFRF